MGASLHQRADTGDGRTSAYAHGRRMTEQDDSHEADAASAAESMRFEGYGPGGAAVIIDCITADRTRTADELRHVFARHGGHLGAGGSVAYLFNTVGVLTFRAYTWEPALRELAFAAGAEDVVVRPDGTLEVLTDPIELGTVHAKLARAGWKPQQRTVTQRAYTAVRLAGPQAASMARLLADLKHAHTVQSVYTNAEISDPILASV